MHPRLAELTDDLARQRAALLSAIAAIPAEDLERRTAPDGWSAAELVDHLSLVEAGTARLLAKRAARAREAGCGPETRTDSVRGCMDRWSIPDAPVRIQAPETVRPRPGVGMEAALTSLQEARAALLATIEEIDGLDLTEVKATHPAFGELDAYQWIVSIVHHEARHLRQLAALAAALRATAP